jgi:hypothetical protein
MRRGAGNRYQNTTLRMPQHIYERAKNAVSRSSDSNFNEFVLEAIEEKLHRLSEAEIDAAFAQMAEDQDFKQESVSLAREFETSDWEAFKISEGEETRKTHVVDAAKATKASLARIDANTSVRSSKARSR